MAPKKKSKKVASSSSSYDSHRFWNEEAQQVYDSSLTRTIIPERGFDLSIRRGRIIPEIERREWVEFAQTPSNAVISIVREFYVNLRIRHDEFQVLVRGRMVAFDSHTINLIYNLPSFDRYEYNELLDEGVDYTMVIRTTCVPGASWKMNQSGPVTLKKSDMTFNAKSWTSFVLARIPPSTHYYDVTKDKMGLVFAIMTRKTIDLGKIIHGLILRAGTGLPMVALPCPHTITYICRHGPQTSS